MGGGIRLDLLHVLQGGHIGNPIFRIRDLSGDPPYQIETQRITPHSGLTFGDDTTAAIYIYAIIVPAIGNDTGNSGPGGGGDILPPAPEHDCSLCNDLSDIGAVSGGGAAAGGAGSIEMVV